MEKNIKNKFNFFLVLLLSLLSLSATEVKAVNDDFNRETSVKVVFKKDNLKAKPIQVSPNEKPKINNLILPGSKIPVKYQSQLPQTGEKLQIGLSLLGLIILLGIIVYLRKSRVKQNINQKEN